MDLQINGILFSFCMPNQVAAFDSKISSKYLLETHPTPANIEVTSLSLVFILLENVPYLLD